MKKRRVGGHGRNRKVVVWNEDTNFPKLWPALYDELDNMFCKCFRLKVDHTNSNWDMWSGAFNRHCRELAKTESNSPYRLLYALWAINNQLLTYNKSVVPRRKHKMELESSKKVLVQDFFLEVDKG